MRAQEKTVDDILFKEEHQTYTIPKFQREYRWSDDKWDLLFSDIQTNEPGYFIGGIICLKQDDEKIGIQNFYVIDGQQRLATLTIAIAAIYRSARERLEALEAKEKKLSSDRYPALEKLKGIAKKISKFDENPTPKKKKGASLKSLQQDQATLTESIKKIENQLTENKRTRDDLIGIKTHAEGSLLIQNARNNIFDHPRLTLSGQKDDDKNYRAVLDYAGLFDRDTISLTNKKLGDTSRHKVGKCFKSFYRKVSSKKDAMPDTADLVSFFNRIRKLGLVDIKADNTADAYVLFESLNNRGEPLNPLDLIKNTILATIEEDAKKPTPSFKIKLDQACEYWDEFINFIPEPKDQTRFLRHIYLAFKKQHANFYLKDIDSVTSQSAFKDVYPRLIRRNAEELLLHFHRKAEVYSDIINPHQVKDPLIKRSLICLDLVEAVPSRIFLLYFLSRYPQGKSRLISEVVDLFTRFFIRRHLTDAPKARDLDAIFVALTELFEETKNTLSDKEVIDRITEFLKAKLAHDISQVISPLREDIVKHSFARALLIRIEAFSRSPEDMPDLWGTTALSRPSFTLEHILPQGDLSQSDPKWDWWRGHLSNDQRVSATEVQDQVVYKLGNLTLTGFNSELSIKPFREKRDMKDQRNNFIGYRNGLRINELLADQEEWRKPQIDQRTDSLIKQLLPTLIFPGERILSAADVTPDVVSD
jgi:uncharacterized protein with ParB-like and HNH nuclease domain